MALSAAHARPVTRRRRGVAAWTAPLVLAGVALVPDPAVDLTGDDTRRAAAATATLSMVSVTPAGKPANGHSAAFSNSGGPSISANGRYAVFSSSATDLTGPATSPPTTAKENIYRRDLVTGTTVAVDVGIEGEPANNSSVGPSVSADGRYVAFRSKATNLVGFGKVQYSVRSNAVYVRDMRTGVTTLVAATPDGPTGTTGGSTWARISADGSTVVFASDDDSFPNRTTAPARPYGGRWSQVYAWTRATQALTLISSDEGGAPAAGDALNPGVSADGRFVAFDSDVLNALGPRDPDGVTSIRQVYLAAPGSRPVLVSVAADGRPMSGSQGAVLLGDTVVSSDGNRVVFLASNPGYSTGLDGAHLYDRNAPRPRLISVGRAGGACGMLRGASLSADGATVTYRANCTDPDTGSATYHNTHVLRRALASEGAEPELLDRRAADGKASTELTDFATRPSISADGARVLFSTRASDLVTGDTNGVTDVFLAAREAGPPPPPPPPPTRPVQVRLASDAAEAVPGQALPVRLQATMGPQVGAARVTVRAALTSTVTSASGTDWTCATAADGKTASCDYPTSSAAGAALPPLDLQVAVPVGAQPACRDSDPSGPACAVVTAWSGDLAAEAGATADRLAVPINGVALRVTVTDNGPFIPGRSGRYDVTVRDGGPAGAPAGTELPNPAIRLAAAAAGTTLVSAAGANWTCWPEAAAVLCGYSGTLSPGGRLSPLTLSYRIGATSAPACARAPCDLLSTSWVQGPREVVVDRHETARGPEPPAPASIELTGTVRDFQQSPPRAGTGYNPDFEGTGSGPDPGIVTDTLGADRIPVYASTDRTPTTNGKKWFDQWYRTTPNVNIAVPYPITLGLATGTGPGTGQAARYFYDGRYFFPVDDRGWNDPSLGGSPQQSPDSRDVLHNFSFTYELRASFTYYGGEFLNVASDDDLFVYLNGRRVVDLGGVSRPRETRVALDDVAASAGLTLGGTYSFDLFTAERRTPLSMLMLDTTLMLQPVAATPVAPDLAANLSFTDPLPAGGSARFVAGVANVGAGATTGPTTLDLALPVGVTATAVRGEGWACQGVGTAALRCTRSTPVAAGAAPPMLVVDAAVDKAARGGEVQVTVSTPGDARADNDRVRSAATVGPPGQDLSGPARLALAFIGDRTLAQGGTARLTGLVRNLGAEASAGPVTVSMLLPAGTPAGQDVTAKAGGSGWTCRTATLRGSRLLRCTSATGVAGNGASSELRIQLTGVSVDEGAPVDLAYQVAWPAGSSRGSHRLDGRAATPSRLAVTLSAPELAAGAPAALAVDVRNDGAGATTGPVLVELALPAGMSATSAGGPGWVCPKGPSLRCTRDAGIPAAERAPPLTVMLRPDRGGAVPVTATVTSTDLRGPVRATAEQLLQVADLRVASVGVQRVPAAGPPRADGKAVYDLAVVNTGLRSVTGVVQITERLPVGSTVVTTGTGWACTSPSGVLTCQLDTSAQPDGQLMTGARTPSLKVVATLPDATAGTGTQLSANATALSNAVRSEALTTATLSRNSPPPKAPRLSVGTTFSPAALIRGQTGTLTLQVSNTGDATERNPIQVGTVLPPGFAVTSMTGEGWTCGSAGSPVAVVCQTDQDAVPVTDPTGMQVAPLAITFTVPADAPAEVTNRAGLLDVAALPPPAPPEKGTKAPDVPAEQRAVTALARQLAAAQGAGLRAPVATDTLAVRGVVADAGPDQTLDALVPDSDGKLRPVNVRLDGSRSQSAGRPVTYAWQQTLGPLVTWAGTSVPAASPPAGSQAVNVGFTSPDGIGHAPVTLGFRLTVSDGTATRTDDVAVVLKPGDNRPPVISDLTSDAAADVIPAAGATVTLTATGSDPDGDQLTWTWAVTRPQTSAPALATTAASPNTASFAWPASISHVIVEATATDAYGGTITRSVTVGVPPPALTVTLDAPKNVSSGELFTVTGTAEGAPPPELSWTWQQLGSGDPQLNVPSTAQPIGDLQLRSPIVRQLGRTATLQVTVSRGAGAELQTATAQVKIEILPQAPPVVSIDNGPVLTVAKGGGLQLKTSVLVKGKGTLTYAWRQVFGPAGSFSSTSATAPTFTAPDDDTIVGLVLDVTDATGGTTPTAVAIKVGNPFSAGSGGLSCAETTSAFRQIYDKVGQGKRPAFTLGTTSVDLGNVTITAPCDDNAQLSFTGASVSIAKGTVTGTGMSGTVTRTGACFSAGTLTLPQEWKLGPASIGSTPLCVTFGGTGPPLTGSLTWPGFPLLKVPPVAGATQPGTTISFTGTSLAVSSTATLAKGGDLVLSATVDDQGRFTANVSGSGVTLLGKPVTVTGTVSNSTGTLVYSVTGSIPGPITPAPGVALSNMSFAWNNDALTFAAQADVDQLRVNLAGEIIDADTWRVTGTGSLTAPWQPLPNLNLTGTSLLATASSVAGVVEFDVRAAVAGAWSPTSRVTVTNLAARVSNTTPPLFCPAAPPGGVFLSVTGRAAVTLTGSPVQAAAEACVVPGTAAWKLQASVNGEWRPLAGVDLAVLDAGVLVQGDTTGITISGIASTRFRGETLTTRFALLPSGAFVVDAAGKAKSAGLGPIPNPHVILATKAVPAWNTLDPSVGTLALVQGVTVVGGFVLPTDIVGLLSTKIQVPNVTAAVVISATLGPDALTFTARIVLGPTGLPFFATCPATPCTDPATTTSFGLTSVFLRVSVTGQVGMGGDARLHLPANPQLSTGSPTGTDLMLKAEVVLDPLRQTVSFGLSMTTPDGGWQNALGLPGLNLGNLAFQGGVDFGQFPPLPTVGLAATVNALPPAWATALGMNPANPEPMTFAVNISKTSPIFQLTLGRPDGKIFLEPLTPVVPAKADLLQVDDASLVIAPLGGSIGPYTFKPGLNLSFNATVLDTPVSLTATVDPTAPSIKAKASLGAFSVSGVVVRNALLDFSVDSGGLLAQVTGNVSLPAGGPALAADVKVAAKPAGGLTLDVRATATGWGLGPNIRLDNLALTANATLAGLAAAPPAVSVALAADAVALGSTLQVNGSANFTGGTLNRLDVRATGGSLQVGGRAITGDGCDAVPGTADDGPCLQVVYDPAGTPTVTGMLTGRLVSGALRVGVTGKLDDTGVALSGVIGLGQRGTVQASGRLFAGARLAGVTAPGPDGVPVQVEDGDWQLTGSGQAAVGVSGFSANLAVTAGSVGGAQWVTGKGSVSAFGSSLAGAVSFSQQGNQVDTAFTGSGTLNFNGRQLAVTATGNNTELSVSGRLTAPGVAVDLAGTVNPQSYSLAGSAGVALPGGTFNGTFALTPTSLGVTVDLTTTRFNATLTGTLSNSGTLCVQGNTSFSVSNVAVTGTLGYCTGDAGLRARVTAGVWTFDAQVGANTFSISVQGGPYNRRLEIWLPDDGKPPALGLGVDISYQLTATMTNTSFALATSGSAQAFYETWHWTAGEGWHWHFNPLASLAFTVDTTTNKACATPSVQFIVTWTRTVCG